MESKQKINLIKERDFSGIFDVSIEFIKQNIGSMLKGMIYAIPVIMLGLFLVIQGQAEFRELSSDIGTMSDPSQIWLLYAKMFTPIATIGYILIWAAGLAMALYALCYVVLYVRSEDGSVTISEVWNFVKKIYLPMIVCHIIMAIGVNLGFILCIIPGIVLSIYILFFPFTYTEENYSITKCFSRSIELVKDSWWQTFAVVLITIFMCLIISGIFSIPNMVSNFAAIFGSSGVVNPIANYITTLISSAGSLITTSLFAIIVGVMYYSRIAATGSVTIEEQIDNIGTKEY